MAACRTVSKGRAKSIGTTGLQPQVCGEFGAGMPAAKPQMGREHCVSYSSRMVKKQRLHSFALVKRMAIGRNVLNAVGALALDSNEMSNRSHVGSTTTPWLSTHGEFMMRMLSATAQCQLALSQ